MTAPKVSTLQYRNFLRRLNAALPLEYMIRATESLRPTQLQELRAADAAIRAAWKKRLVSEADVIRYGLDQLIWDLAQLGWPERRAPDEKVPDDLLKIIREENESIVTECLSDLTVKDYPFAQRYRCADLVRGMHVRTVLDEYLDKRKDLRTEPSDGEISESNFLVFFKAPVPVIPGAIQRVRGISPGTENHMGLLLRYDMPSEDIRAALLEFQYHFAVFRKNSHGLQDETLDRLVNPWVDPDMPSAEDLIDSNNQIHPKLAGLYAYDCFVKHVAPKSRGAKVDAIRQTIAEHRGRLEPSEKMVGVWLDAAKEHVEASKNELLDEEVKIEIADYWRRQKEATAEKQ